MEGNTHGGFRFGAWQALPSRNLLVGPRGEIHIEPKVMQVLEYLARTPGQVVERDTLLNGIWEGRVFSDEPLSRCIFELRRALGDSSKDSRYIETIPKSGYRFIATVEPLADAADDTSDTPDEESGMHQRGVLGATRRIAVAGLLGLIVIVALYAVYRFILIDPPDSPQIIVDGALTSARPVYSVAVLPFKTLSAFADESYFADGLAVEVLNSVSQLPELQVTGRASSFFFKDKDIPISEIAAHLNVAYVIEGSVRRNGDDLRISASLTRTSDGLLMWSDSYERTLFDVFEIQTDIAENIATVMGVMLDDQARRRMQDVRINDVQAFTAYQKGLEAFTIAHHSNSNFVDGLAIANAYFDEVLELSGGGEGCFGGIAGRTRAGLARGTGRQSTRYSQR
jgi:TolB-like protein/DNA-binding winged helix-turn-helix (wHTH) protein